MSRRLEFVEDATRGLYTMTELCARYSISRRVGYKWLARYDAEGAEGLTDQRRVAHSHPHRLSEEIAACLLACRLAHPAWGPRKLLAYLARRHPQTRGPPPAPWGRSSSARGSSARARRRPQPGHPGRPRRRWMRRTPSGPRISRDSSARRTACTAIHSPSATATRAISSSPRLPGGCPQWRP